MIIFQNKETGVVEVRRQSGDTMFDRMELVKERNKRIKLEEKMKKIMERLGMEDEE